MQHYPEHVQATIRFASTNNLRLVIKSTGHDYLGRSTTAGSLLLWLHSMKNMTLIEDYSSCNLKNVSNAVRLDAGVQWSEVYRWLNEFNLTAIGGASGTVGAAGGYLQGGGHSPLSRWKGMAADQVLEYDVVTADGQRQTVSACQNGDLFWALSGGGGGTYAVVLSVVLKTFPSPSIAAVTFSIVTLTEPRYKRLMNDFIRMLPSLADDDWSGYFTIIDATLSGVFYVPNGNLTSVNETVNQFATNNSDLNFGNSSVFFLPSFYHFAAFVLEPNNPTGFNVLLTSRLIPDATIRNSPEQVANVFFQAKGQSAIRSGLLGHLVAGGQVANISNTNNSVNPAWRTALLHMVYYQSWPDLTSEIDLKYIAEAVTRRGAILDTVLSDSESRCYTNEADPNEPNWEEKYFGSRAMYDRLKSIKQNVDPNGLFVCKNLCR